MATSKSLKLPAATKSSPADISGSREKTTSPAVLFVKHVSLDGKANSVPTAAYVPEMLPNANDLSGSISA